MKRGLAILLALGMLFCSCGAPPRETAQDAEAQQAPQEREVTQEDERPSLPELELITVFETTDYKENDGTNFILDWLDDDTAVYTMWNIDVTTIYAYRISAEKLTKVVELQGEHLDLPRITAGDGICSILSGDSWQIPNAESNGLDTERRYEMLRYDMETWELLDRQPLEFDRTGQVKPYQISAQGDIVRLNDDKIIQIIHPDGTILYPENPEGILYEYFSPVWSQNGDYLILYNRTHWQNIHWYGNPDETEDDNSLYDVFTRDGVYVTTLTFPSGSDYYWAEQDAILVENPQFLNYRQENERFVNTIYLTDLEGNVLYQTELEELIVTDLHEIAESGFSFWGRDSDTRELTLYHYNATYNTLENQMGALPWEAVLRANTSSTWAAWLQMQDGITRFGVVEL